MRMQSCQQTETKKTYYTLQRTAPNTQLIKKRHTDVKKISFPFTMYMDDE